MALITQRLESISLEALNLGVDLKAHLRPPASAAEVERAAQKLPYLLPDEVAEMYLWRNGVWPEGQPFEFRILPMFFYPPVDIAGLTMKELLSEQKAFAQPFWQVEWFPLFMDGAGGYLVVNIDNRHEEFGRILRIMEAFPPFNAFWNLDSMLLSILECYKAGAYFLDEEGFLEDDIELSSTIYRDLNHGLCLNR